MSVFLLLARVLLFAVFAVAGLAKLADPAGSRKSLAGFGVSKALAKPLALLLPLAELVCAVALIPLASAWYGAIGVLVLLVGFIAAIAVSLVRGRRPDCHCFGQLHSAPVGWQTLVRNCILAGLCGAIVALGPGAGVLAWRDGMSGTMVGLTVLSIALGALAVFEVWALVHVLRQNGRLMLRVDALEAKVAADGGRVEAPPPGLAVGEEAPAFGLTDLGGRTVTLEKLEESGKVLLLLFTEPGCGACDDALPEVSQWQRDYREKLVIVPISRGEVAENRSKAERYGLKNVLLQVDREVAEAYQAGGTPSAVLVREGNIDSSVAQGIDEIRGLVARATLPPPVRVGDSVPSLRLPDLSGKLVDLADLNDGRVLMLFWNPSCGYCQQMLGELKNWEKNPGEDAPELVVISAGSLEDNRKQGFRSRVLLDPYYGASQVFQSGGTPSAVMIEDGRLVSSVAVGAQEVWALAKAVPEVIA